MIACTPWKEKWHTSLVLSPILKEGTRYTNSANKRDTNNVMKRK